MKNEKWTIKKIYFHFPTEIHGFQSNKPYRKTERTKASLFHTTCCSCSSNNFQQKINIIFFSPYQHLSSAITNQPHSIHPLKHPQPASFSHHQHHPPHTFILIFQFKFQIKNQYHKVYLSPKVVTHRTTATTYVLNFPRIQWMNEWRTVTDWIAEGKISINFIQK